MNNLLTRTIHWHRTEDDPPPEPKRHYDEDRDVLSNIYTIFRYLVILGDADAETYYEIHQWFAYFTKDEYGNHKWTLECQGEDKCEISPPTGQNCQHRRRKERLNER